MRRRARATPFARRKLIREMDARPENEWPQRINDANEILAPLVSKQNAHKILRSSVSAAHGCALAIDRRAGDVGAFQKQEKLRANFERVANCIKRASAELRQHLDEAILPLLTAETIDLEMIDSILDTAVTTFRRHSDEIAARTALDVLVYRTPGGQEYETAKVDFAGLSMECRLRCERTIAQMGQRTGGIVFATLAAALEDNKCQKANSQIFDLIIEYVVQIAKVWRCFNLKPARGRPPCHTSRFHRFCELILTEATEPDSLRHTGKDFEKLRSDIRTTHQQLANELRRVTSNTLRKADWEWLVSDYHLARALSR